MRIALITSCLLSSSFVYSFKSARPFAQHRLLLRMEASTLLSSQTNAYLKESVNPVLLCEKIPTTDGTFKVFLKDSILYPEGGGQPCDLGFVDDFRVLKVSKPTDIPESLKSIKNIVEVELTGPVDVGTEVRCAVDWKRRYEFMQQHTAQHLFSAVADLLFHVDTVGWAMGTDSATVDLASIPALSTEQLQQIEDEVNNRIRAGSAVNWTLVAKSALENPEAHPELKYLRGEVKGPALQMEELRMVSIEDLDVNPCGGTHLNSLSEINVFKIIGCEKDRGSLRVRFVAGHRALDYFRLCVDREAQMSGKLSAPPTDHVSIVEKLSKDKRDLSKRYEIYADELATYWGKSLAECSTDGVIGQHRAGADLKFLIKAATTAHELNPNSIILLSGDEGMPIAPNAKLTNKSIANKALAGPFVLFGDPVKINKVKDKILELLGGRGGGRPGKLQGQAVSLERLADALAFIKDEQAI
jgi:misacylated tRNA(Ala) deacylase